MHPTRLSDLDELALTVRDNQSQIYILEALSAYRGGAYRSAIISTWIAVTYDIIAKIRELASKNDPAAETFVRSLDSAIQNRDLPRMQKIEDGLLDSAKKDFELLAEHEVEDFLRLQKDRNRCAHPAFVTDDSLFQPSPELVRTHIVHAVVHLLQHQPMQGKSALARVMADIKRASFPVQYDDIYAFLADNYLNRAKEVLIRNLAVVLLKALLKDEHSATPGQQQILCYCLLAISRRHPVIYDQEMRNRLPQIVGGLEDKGLARVFRLLAADSKCWQWLTTAQQVQLKQLAEQVVNSKDAARLLTKYAVFDSMSVPELNSFLMPQFGKLSSYDQEQVIGSSPRPEFTAAAISLYAKSGSYRGAADRGKGLILPLAQYFTASQIGEIVQSVLANNQIWDAGGTGEILEQFFDLTRDRLPETADAWRSVAEQSKANVEWYGGYRFPGLMQRLWKADVVERDDLETNP